MSPAHLPRPPHSQLCLPHTHLFSRCIHVVHTMSATISTCIMCFAACTINSYSNENVCLHLMSFSLSHLDQGVYWSLGVLPHDICYYILLFWGCIGNCVLPPSHVMFICIPSQFVAICTHLISPVQSYPILKFYYPEVSEITESLWDVMERLAR